MSVNIILWIVFGVLLGWIANTNMKRNSEMGVVANIFIGIAGATIGGFLMILAGAGGASGFNLYNLLVAILSAGILLFVVGLMQSEVTP